MDPFYQLQHKNIEGDHWSFNLSLNADHPVYEGHFPEKAVTPGVMMTEMVKHLIEDELGQKLRMTAARNIKFLNLILPENAKDMTLVMDLNRTEGIAVKAQATIGEAIYFKISANYTTI